MTLGEIIKQYVDNNSMVFFVHRSGLSRAYAYMLINDKNSKGDHISPSIETIQKVANGVGLTLDEIFTLLDYDYVVKAKSQESGQESPQPETTSRERFLLNQYLKADEKTKLAVDVLLEMSRFEKENISAS